MTGISSSIFRQTPYFLNFIFDGKMFVAFRKQTVSGNATIFLQTRTGATRLFHTITRSHGFQGGGPFTVDILENPTLTDGTEFIVFNMDRRSTRTSQTRWFDAPTGVTGGTVIDSLFIPSGGVGSQGAATFASGAVERVLKLNTNYITKITNESANAATFYTNILYYESDN